VGANRHCLTHSEAEEEAGLAHRGVADQEKLEQVISIEGRQANKGGKSFGSLKRWKIRGGKKGEGDKLTTCCSLRFPPFDSKNSTEEKSDSENSAGREERRMEMLSRGTGWDRERRRC
jgi:hypothetical protein